MSRHAREMTQLARRLERMGYVVRKGRNGHWKVAGADGKVFIGFPATPGDHRSILNTLAQLRRSGIDV